MAWPNQTDREGEGRVAQGEARLGRRDFWRLAPLGLALQAAGIFAVCALGFEFFEQLLLCIGILFLSSLPLAMAIQRRLLDAREDASLAFAPYAPALIGSLLLAYGVYILIGALFAALSASLLGSAVGLFAFAAAGLLLLIGFFAYWLAIAILPFITAMMIAHVAGLRLMKSHSNGAKA